MLLILFWTLMKQFNSIWFKNIKNKNEQVILIGGNWSLYVNNKKLFFSCVCIKWLKSAKKNIKNVKEDIIDKGRYFGVNRKDSEV